VHGAAEKLVCQADFLPRLARQVCLPVFNQVSRIWRSWVPRVDFRASSLSLPSHPSPEKCRKNRLQFCRNRRR
jgi:hypothetical protein